MNHVRQILLTIKRFQVVFDPNDGINIHYLYLIPKGEEEKKILSSSVRRKEYDNNHEYSPFNENLEVVIKMLIVKYFRENNILKPENWHEEIFLPLKKMILDTYFK